MLQDDALKILKTGRNVYLTGAAGTGKTYVLNKYIDYLKRHKVRVAITASTGIAATHLGGMTIHSWSGIGIKTDLTDKDIDLMEQKQHLVNRINDASVLIIDEVSMLTPDMLDMVNQVCRFLRRDKRPFGGMQIVLSGDFFQLPPVVQGVRPGEELFANSSRAWEEANIKTCYLTEQYRQQNNKLANILNNIRSGTLSENDIALLKSRVNVESDNTLLQPVRLYTHNKSVDAINKKELDKISERKKVYTMTKKGNARLVTMLTKSVLAPETLELKVGAKVMFVKNNFDQGYVNGTMGEVTDFHFDNPVITTIDGNEIEVKLQEWIMEDNGRRLASITQLPLRLAWAITVHKSQGMSLDCAEMDLSKVFAPGQGYVALSRVRDLNGLFLLNDFNENALRIHPRAMEIDKNLQRESRKWERVIASFSKDKLNKMYNEHLERCRIG